MLEQLHEDIDGIEEELRQYDETDEETLEDCTERADRGIEYIISKRCPTIEKIALLYKLQGEWIIMKIRSRNQTEEEFADRFLGKIGQVLMRDVFPRRHEYESSADQ